MPTNPVPAGSYCGLVPAVRKALTDGGAAFVVLGLHTSGTIAAPSASG